MRLATPTCPHCRERAVAALETVPITMSFEGDPREGSVRYGDGANNVLDWNHQRPVVGPGGRPLVVCVNGHQWETVIEDETRTRPTYWLVRAIAAASGFVTKTFRRSER